MTQLYEYRVEVITARDPKRIARLVNAIALDGWRLVTVENCQNPYGEHRYVFEREIAPARNVNLENPHGN